MKVYLTDCISNLIYIQSYVIRINAADDDGMLGVNTITNLTRMALNMPPFVKASILVSLPRQCVID